MSLTEFLLARIAEDEYEAQVCLDQYARGDGGSTPRWRKQLAECEAKRRIVEAHRTQCADDDDHAWIVGSEVLLKSLAAVYADHPEYDPAWA